MADKGEQACLMNCDFVEVDQNPFDYQDEEMEIEFKEEMVEKLEQPNSAAWHDFAIESSVPCMPDTMEHGFAGAENLEVPEMPCASSDCCNNQQINLEHLLMLIDTQPLQHLSVKDVDQILAPNHLPQVYVLLVSDNIQRQQQQQQPQPQQSQPQPAQFFTGQKQIVACEVEQTSDDEMSQGDGGDGGDGEDVEDGNLPALECLSPGLSSEFEEAASTILRVHQQFSLKFNPNAKKKPMLHEFMGYILFKQINLPLLENCMHFCSLSGVQAMEGRAEACFKVEKFEVVGEIWKRVKNNHSDDTVKNMKRAMRMSTNNNRAYFENLSHKKHRERIFKFGPKSIASFNQAFPTWYQDE